MRRYRRHLITLAIVLLLVGLYAVAGFWAVPHFARSGAQNFVTTHYGRTLSIGEIRFNPFTLKLDVADVSLPDADGKVLLSFRRLHVALQLASIWRFGPSFSEILLDKPYVRAVIRHGGALNLADLGKGFPEEPQKPPPQSRPVRLYIERLAVSAGSSTFEDLTRPTPFKADFDPITFELRDFSTVGAGGSAYALTAASEQGERLKWNGTLRLAPLSSQGEFEIADLKARTVWDYVHELVSLELDSGVIDIRGGYDLSTGGGPLALKLQVHNVTVTDLGVKPKGAPQDYIKLTKIAVDDTRIDVTKHSVEVAKVTLSGGQLQVWVDEQGRVNLRELAQSAPAAPAAAAATPAATDGAPPDAPARASSSGGNSAPWAVSVPDISVEGLRINAEDREVQPALALTVEPLNVHIGGFNTSPDDVLQVSVDSLINGHAKLTAKGKVIPRGAQVSAHIEATDLALPFIQPYISRYTSMTLLRGTLGAKVDLDLRDDGFLEVKGESRVSGLRTVDNSQRRDFITWKELKVSDFAYRSKPQSLKVKAVTATDLFARMVIRPDQTLNITEVLQPAGTPPRHAASEAGVPAARAAPAPVKQAPKSKSKRSKTPAAATPPRPNSGAPFPIAINTVRFVNTTLDYTDLWIKPSFSVSIQSLDGAVTGLSSDPDSRAKVELNGKVDRYWPAHIGGEANLLSTALYTDITMSFHDIDLTIVNPYSGHYLGYKIDKGKLSVDVSYKIEQRKLQAKQHFVVDQLELGERVESPDAIHAPLKLAVALLKDRNGLIDIDLPMSGSIDDPQFRLGPIIWKAFVNLIVKVVTAPFALLGQMFGGGNEHLNVVEFAPGAAELDPASKEQMAAVVKSLKERPQLKLDVPITYSATLDRPKLAEVRLHEQLQGRAQSSRHGKKHPDTAGAEAFADPKKHFELLLEQYKEVAGKEAPLPDTVNAVLASKGKDTPAYEPAIADLNAALLKSIEVPESDLVDLGKNRARAIQDALIVEGGIEPSRVFIVDAPPKPEGGDKVKVEIALK